MATYAPRWIADDGSEHKSEEACLRHEMQVLLERELDYWLAEQKELAPKKASEYRRIILLWETRSGASKQADPEGIDPNAYGQLPIPPMDGPDPYEEMAKELLREGSEQLEEA